MMKRTMAILLAFLTLVGCQGFPFSNLEAEAQRKLNEALQALPVPPGAELLAQVSVYSGGTMAQCAAQELQVLFGTNQSAFAEVLDFYRTVLPPAGWTWEGESAEMSGFRKGPKYSLALAVTNLFGGRTIGRSTRTAAESEFATVYILVLSIPLREPYPSECRQ